MKIFCVALLSVLILGLTAPAKADRLPGGDPRVRTGGGLPLIPEANYYVPAGIIDQSFTIESPSGTSPASSPCVLMQGGITTVSPGCLFENDISVDGVGEAIVSLVFDVTGVNASTVTCGFLAGSPFAGCSVVPLGSLGPEGAQITFDDGSIPFHTDFSMQFTGFPQDSSFGATAALTPEPGTLALLLGGLGTLLARRRSRPE
ncbi:MAG TPA: PEP-CTERM sorting domain-containing protein [Terriglobia bacterium]